MGASVSLLFVVNAVLALLASSLIAWQLQTYVNDNATLNNFVAAQQEVFLTKAEVQLLRMQDFVDREVLRMRLSTNETRRLTLQIANDPAIRTSAGALGVMNSTLFRQWAHRVSFAKEQYGFAVNFLYPADTDNVTWVQSMQTYADPLFNGGLQPIHAWTDTATGVMSAFQINLVPVATPVTAASVTDDVVVQLDTSTVQYTFNYFDNAALGIGYHSRFDNLPWQSSDGNPWYFPQQSSWLKLQGVNIVVQSYASTVYWADELTALLNSNAADYVLVDGTQTVIATSYEPEITRRAACIRNSSGAALLDCISSPLKQHSLAFLRFVGSELFDRVGDAKFFVPLSNSSTYASTTYDGRRLVAVHVTPSTLEGPSQQKFELMWFQFDPPQASTSGANSSIVPVLISFMLLVAVGSTVGMGALLQRTFLSPMQRLVERMMAVTELDTEAIAISAKDAHGIEQAGFSEMQQMRLAFGKMAASMQWFLLYLPGDVVKDIMAAGSEGMRQSVRELEERELTVLFADIRGFTSATAALRGQLDVFVELLQMYFEHCSNALTDEGCTIDKYIGDAIMGFWGAPLLCSDQAERACLGAIRMASVVDTIRGRFAEHGWDLGVRIGVHKGPAMVGSIGSRRRLNYTALGETINMASRLEGLCKYTDSNILVSSTVAFCLSDGEVVDSEDGSSEGHVIALCKMFCLRRHGLFLLKGADTALGAYSLCGLSATAFDRLSVSRDPLTSSVSDMTRRSSCDALSNNSLNNKTSNGPAHKLRRRPKRSTIAALAKRFRVSDEIACRLEYVCNAQAQHDSGYLQAAVKTLDELLDRHTLFSAEQNEALPPDAVKLLTDNKVTRGDVVQLRYKFELLVMSHRGGGGNASSAFDPVVYVTEK